MWLSSDKCGWCTSFRGSSTNRDKSEKRLSISYTLKLNNVFLTVSTLLKFHIVQYLSHDLTSPMTSLWRNYDWTWQPPLCEYHKANFDCGWLELFGVSLKLGAILAKNDRQYFGLEWNFCSGSCIWQGF